MSYDVSFFLYMNAEVAHMSFFCKWSFQLHTHIHISDSVHVCERSCRLFCRIVNLETEYEFLRNMAPFLTFCSPRNKVWWFCSRLQGVHFCNGIQLYLSSIVEGLYSLSFVRTNSWHSVLNTDCKSIIWHKLQRNAIFWGHPHCSLFPLFYRHYSEIFDSHLAIY